MHFDLYSIANLALQETPWDLGNQVLYDLCSKYPSHKDTPAVIAKIWLIGRSYAAAIERRRDKEDQNDDFYVQTVAPVIIDSDIDHWIQKAAKHSIPSSQSFEDIIFAHADVTWLFSKISRLEKRSLASKYLHFHLPHLFYIYDTRAVEAMRLLSSIVGRASGPLLGSDNEYRKFAEKCLRLQEHINSKLHVLLTPRQIDNLLLNLHASHFKRI